MPKYAYCTAGLVVGLTACVLAGAQTPVLFEELKLVPAQGAPSNRFGRSVDVSGPIGLVGEPFANGAAPNSGAAYLFDLRSGQQLSRLTQVAQPGDDSPAEDGFGEDVALGGDVALIGGPNNETEGVFSGAAYTFSVVDREQTERLLPFSPPPFMEAGSAFGEHVSVSADGARMIIGARGDTGEDDQGANGGGGAVYLYDNVAGTAIKVFASDAAFADNFGTNVAISDEFAIASAPFNDDAGSSSGSVYLLDPDTGAELAILRASDAAPQDLFGYQLAISGSMAAIATPFADGAGGVDTGAVYLFDLITREELLKITLEGAAPLEQFGFDVSMDGALIAIGSATGRAWVYDIEAGGFIAELRPSDPAPEQFFATAVGIDGMRVIVGAEGDEANGERSGAAYVYDLASLVPEGASRVASIDPGFFPRGNRFGAEVAVSVQDTDGTPVAGAIVTARAFGGIVQTLRGTTDANGVVVLSSLRASEAPFTYTVCVFNIVSELPYDARANAQTCASASAP
ncbi:MAG: hypothetical protein AAGA68_19930 [Pseudomonadota bacterium]